MSHTTGDLVDSTDQLTYADADITRQALVHSSAMAYLMVAYARECGRSPEHAADFAGRLLAKEWARFVGEDAQAIARHIGLILICIGGEIEAITGDGRHAEIRASGVLTDEDARFFGISRDEADRFCDVFVPMTAALGFAFSWRRVGDELIFTLSVP